MSIRDEVSRRRKLMQEFNSGEISAAEARRRLKLENERSDRRFSKGVEAQREEVAARRLGAIVEAAVSRFAALGLTTESGRPLPVSSGRGYAEIERLIREQHGRQNGSFDLAAALENARYLDRPCARCGARTMFWAVAAPGIGDGFTCLNGHSEERNQVRELTPAEVR